MKAPPVSHAAAEVSLTTTLRASTELSKCKSMVAYGEVDALGVFRLPWIHHVD
jgi:hypothetical protein